MKRSYFIAATASAVSIASPLLAGAEGLTKRERSGTNVTASGWHEPTWYCGSAVVWLNVESGIYYHKGDRLYGLTKRGAYVCQNEAVGTGNRASRIATS